MKTRVALTLIALAGAGSAAAQIAVGPEFQVNSSTLGFQERPSVAADASGNFVVAWWSRSADFLTRRAFVRRYSRSGVPLTPELPVGTSTSLANTYGPSVASDASGGFVVAWSQYSGNQGLDVFVQRYDSTGAPLGSPFQANVYTFGAQLGPSVASTASGDFVVAWHGASPSDSDGVSARRFDASGAPVGGEFRVNTYLQYQQYGPQVALDGDGNFIVVWQSAMQDGSVRGIYGQRYDANGMPRGAEFRVNTYTPAHQFLPSVATDAAGNFVVTWSSQWQDDDGVGVFARRYLASGAPVGDEFQVNTYTGTYASGWQANSWVASDRAGNFIVTWESYGQDGDNLGVFAQWYDLSGARLGDETRINAQTASSQGNPVVVTAAGLGFVVAWVSDGQDGSATGIFAQRFAAVMPSALAVDSQPSSGSDGNGVLDPGEASALVKPSWKNLTGGPQTLDGVGTSFDGPPATGVAYVLEDGSAAYGTVADGATGQCTDCYAVAVNFGGTRPAAHWDATFVEQVVAGAFDGSTSWTIHIGETFTDVPRTSIYYRDVETIAHRGVTAGCAASSYCPADSVTREQLAVFTLKAREGGGYEPPLCDPPAMFADVPIISIYCSWIQELARRGVVAGCGGGNYCPAAAVTREQMPVFVLRLLEPALVPPACTTPMFADVPATSPFCRWIEELARRGVVTGCGGGLYCPTAPVTREQMAVFLTGTYGLTLYGP
jgi:hypothetical protein